MILIGLDFLDGSRAALDQARSLAHATGSPAEVLHVREYGDAGGWEPGPDQLAWMESAGLTPAMVHTRKGVPWVELVRFARERGAAMIVAGRHGGSGAQPFTLGSTALRLATHAPHPVLLVGGAHAPTNRKGPVLAEGEWEDESPVKSPLGNPTLSDAG